MKQVDAVRVDSTCSRRDSNSKLEKYRMVENERTKRTKSVNAERQRSRVRRRVKCSNETESGEESGNVGKRDDAMQLRWNVSRRFV